MSEKLEFLEKKGEVYVFKIPRGFYYTEHDSWGKVVDSFVRVGVTDYIQRMVGDMLFVEFMVSVGDVVDQFREVARYEGLKSVMELESPIGGEIVEINQEVMDNPEIINKEPYGKGWFAIIKPTNLEKDLENLLKDLEFFELMSKRVEEAMKKS